MNENVKTNAEVNDKDLEMVSGGITLEEAKANRDEKLAIMKNSIRKLPNITDKDD